jgi:hypothetical protein
VSHICLTFEYACQDQLNSQPLMIYKHQHEPFGVPSKACTPENVPTMCPLVRL